MNCELPGYSECPVVGLANQINGLELVLDGVGTQIRNSSDPDELKQLGTQAGNLRKQINDLQRQKNGINKCAPCPVV